MQNILFVCSLIACVIGIITFLVGVNNRSKSDGVILQKVEQTIKGIEELKLDIKSINTNEKDMALEVERHSQQIKTLFSLVETNRDSEKLVERVCKYLEDLISMRKDGV